MEQFEGQERLSFIKELPNDTVCKAYLAKIKWQDGFTCIKCGHNKGCEKSDYRYHCYSCQHVESATENTLFHKVKFGLQKAFCVVFEMSTSSKSISSIQMRKRFSIRQGTAWYFMQKVRKATKTSQKYSSQKLIHVDEFTIGGIEEEKQGRADDTKKAEIAVQITGNNKIKSVYIGSIKDYSPISLILIFEEHISTSAKIVTDKWRGYEPLKETYGIEQRL